MGKRGGFQQLWNTRRGNRLIGFGLPAAAALLLGGMAWTGFNPVGVFPPCIFLRLTGFHCPGCGTTRMAAALLRGDIGAAIYYNPFTLLLGVGGAFGLLWLGLRTFRKNWHPLNLHVQSRWWLLAPLILVLYWVGRNLPAYQSYFF